MTRFAKLPIRAKFYLLMSLLLLVLFLRIEAKRGDDALMPFGLFGTSTFAGLSLLTLLLYAALAGLLVLLVAALAVDAVLLTAMLARIAEFGASPNKFAALGLNLLLLVHLTWAARLSVGFLRGRTFFTALERWQTRYLPVYGVWAAVVVVVFPPVFAFA